MKTILTVLIFAWTMLTSVATATELDVVVLLDTSSSTEKMEVVELDPGSLVVISTSFPRLLRESVAGVVRAIPVEPHPLRLSAYDWGSSLRSELLPPTVVVNQSAMRQLADLLKVAHPSDYDDGTDLPTSLNRYLAMSGMGCGVVIVVTHDVTSNLESLPAVLESLPLSIEVHILLFEDDGHEAHLNLYRQVIPEASRHSVGELTRASAPSFMRASLERTARHCYGSSS